MKNYFICLIPEVSKELDEALENFIKSFPDEQIKYPLHLTLYFLGNLNDVHLNKAYRWLNQFESTTKTPILAHVNGMDAFLKEGKPFVFFLDVVNKKILDLNIDLFANFHDIRIDDFSFRPHISLSFPKTNWPVQKVNKMKEIFGDVKTIRFDKIAIAYEVDGEIVWERVFVFKRIFK